MYSLASRFKKYSCWLLSRAEQFDSKKSGERQRASRYFDKTTVKLFDSEKQFSKRAEWRNKMSSSNQLFSLLSNFKMSQLTNDCAHTAEAL
jgi:type III secretory pathway component EscR